MGGRDVDEKPDGDVSDCNRDSGAALMVSLLGLLPIRASHLWICLVVVVLLSLDVVRTIAVMSSVVLLRPAHLPR